MEDYMFVSQLCEDQALCIKVQLLIQGTAKGLFMGRMKWSQAAQGIITWKKSQYDTREKLYGHQSLAHITLPLLDSW